MNKAKKIIYSFAGGLVPCEGLDCTWCDLFQLFKNIIDFALMIIFPLAAVMIVYGGFLIMTGGPLPNVTNVPSLKRGKGFMGIPALMKETKV